MHARIEQQQFACHRCGTIDQPDHRIGNLRRSAGPLQWNGPFVLALQQLQAALAGSARLSASLAGFWISILSALPAAYLFSLAADLSTRLYLLLRARADGEPPATISGHGLG